MSATQPLPSPVAPVDHAQLIAMVQGQLESAARQIKAVALDLVDQHHSAGLLRLVDAIRRQAILAALSVADLQNEATRQAYESGAPLPPDTSSSGPLFPAAGALWNGEANASASTVPPGVLAAPDAFLNGS